MQFQSLPQIRRCLGRRRRRSCRTFLHSSPNRPKGKLRIRQGSAGFLFSCQIIGQRASDPHVRNRSPMADPIKSIHFQYTSTSFNVAASCSFLRKSVTSIWRCSFWHRFIINNAPDVDVRVRRRHFLLLLLLTLSYKELLLLWIGSALLHISQLFAIRGLCLKHAAVSSGIPHWQHCRPLF